MRKEVKVPPVGESITEGVVSVWHVADGDVVEVEDALFDLETDKITLSVPAEVSGRIEILIHAGEKVAIGAVVASIDTDSGQKGAPTPTEAHGAVDTVKSNDSAPKLSAPAGEEQFLQKLSAQSEDDLSPAVRRMVKEHNLDAALIPSTGKGGRLTKEDVVHYLDRRSATVPPPPAIAAPDSAPSKELPKPRPEAGERQTRRPMTMLRARIAERLVLAQQNAAILTTFNEVDMSAVMRIREFYKDKFLKQHRVKLGIMSFFVKAVVDALRAVPAVNAWIDGDSIVENHYYDIGVAVSTERGLVVPVLRDCDKLSFVEIEQKIADFSERAMNKSLTLEELSGGVFTISNGGVFGSLLSTPILNPPQSAILGMHGIKKRPVAVGEDDRIEVRPMMYLALSYDHRLIDGREAVTFLKRIVECIESPERLMLGI